MDMRGYEIEAKLDRLEMAVEGLRNEVEGIKRDIQKAHAAEAAMKAEETGTPKKRTRKKAEPAE